MAIRFWRILASAGTVRLALVALCIALMNSQVTAPRAGSLEGPALYPLMRGSVTAADRKFGFVDANGHWVVLPQYDLVGNFVEGRARVHFGKKVGFIDELGQLVVPAIYDHATDFSEGLTVVNTDLGKGKQWRVIDRDGYEIVPPGYDWIGRIHDGMIVVGSKPAGTQPIRFGAIDTTGHPIIDLMYERLDTFVDGLAPVKINGKWGYISKTGELVVPPTYTYARSFIGGLAGVTVDGPNGQSKMAIIAPDGKFVLKPVHDLVGEFKDGKVVASDYLGHRVEMLHLIDRSGTRLRTGIGADRLCGRDPYRQWIPDDLTVLKTDGRCFYADSDGNNRYGRDFATALPFVDGLARVGVSAREAFGTDTKSKRIFFGVIDDGGVLVVPPLYDSVSFAGPHMIRVSFDNRDEFLDRTGRPLTFAKADLDKYTAQMRVYLAPIVRDPERTVTARAADEEYYLMLPLGYCVLDASIKADGRIIENMKGAPSGLFASCEELRHYRIAADEKSLTFIGTASGLRHGKPDPSADAGIVYMSRFMCGAMRAGSIGGLKQQAQQSEKDKRDRISQAWQAVEKDQPAQLGGIEDHLLGCTSARLTRDNQGQIAANFISMILLQDWSVTTFRSAKPKSETEFLELLRIETEMANSITQVAMDAMKAESR